MGQTPISSRAYKFMRRTSRFAGTADRLRQPAAAFWHACRQVIRPLVVDADGDLDTLT